MKMKRYNNYRHTQSKPVAGRNPREVGSWKTEEDLFKTVNIESSSEQRAASNELQDQPFDFAQGDSSLQTEGGTLIAIVGKLEDMPFDSPVDTRQSVQGDSNGQPATSNGQPATSNGQPATSNGQRATSNEQPEEENFPDHLVEWNDEQNEFPQNLDNDVSSLDLLFDWDDLWNTEDRPFDFPDIMGEADLFESNGQRATRDQSPVASRQQQEEERSVPEEAESREHGVESIGQGTTSNEQQETSFQQPVTSNELSEAQSRSRVPGTPGQPATSHQQPVISTRQPATEKSAPAIAEINRYVSIRRQIAMEARKLEDSRNPDSYPGGVRSRELEVRSWNPDSYHEEVQGHHTTERQEQKDRIETLSARRKLTRVPWIGGKLNRAVSPEILGKFQRDKTVQPITREMAERPLDFLPDHVIQVGAQGDSIGDPREDSRQKPVAGNQHPVPSNELSEAQSRSRVLRTSGQPGTSIRQPVPSNQYPVTSNHLSNAKSHRTDPTDYVRSMPAFRSFVVSTIRRLIEEQRFLSAEPESSRFLARELGVEMWSEGQRAEGREQRARSKEQRVERSSILIPSTRDTGARSKEQRITSNQQRATSNKQRATGNGQNNLNRERFALMEAMINAKSLYSNMRIRW
jgi:hypothetical protein